MESTLNTSGENHEQQDNSEPGNSMFECNICFETAKDPVISFCGHLFWYV